MRYGLYIPPFGDYADARVLADLARDAEEAGWDGFFLWDHLTLEYEPDAPMVDIWVALTAIAMRTERIRFGPLVTPIARRRPWKLARETASLDQLSGGRLILGVGAGVVNPPEYEHLGEPGDLKVRAAMLDEGLEILTGLWRGEPFSYTGAHYTVKEACFIPTPAQQPRIPIWVAGLWPNKAPMRRAARWDGVYPLNRDDPTEDMTPEQIKEVVAYVTAHRKSDAPFDVVHRGTTPGRDSAEDAAESAAIVATYAEAGVTWWVESIGPWRFEWNFQPPWPTEAMRACIRKGPPRLPGS